MVYIVQERSWIQNRYARAYRKVMVMKYTQEQIEAIVKKEEARKQRQRKTTQRQLAKQRIILRKAKEKGITVTEEEIKKEMSKK